jgi:hypothetical protein
LQLVVVLLMVLVLGAGGVEVFFCILPMFFPAIFLRELWQLLLFNVCIAALHFLL